MALINYSKLTNFCDSAEAMILLVQIALVQLRDYAEFHDENDPEIKPAAEILYAVVEDMKPEIERLLGRI